MWSFDLVTTTEPLAGAANARALPAFTQRCLFESSQPGSVAVNKQTNTHLFSFAAVASKQTHFQALELSIWP